LKEQLDLVALPRKGKLSEQAQALEQSDAFARARRAHSGVESAINALEVHGLDRCPDHGINGINGINGFKRYAALAVVARNIHRIGAILWQHEQERAWRPRKCTPEPLRAGQFQKTTASPEFWGCQFFQNRGFLPVTK
jgi:hypothetical protein